MKIKQFRKDGTPEITLNRNPRYLTFLESRFNTFFDPLI